MLILTVHLITVSAVFIVYLAYQRLECKQMPQWWQGTVDKVYSSYSRILPDRPPEKSAMVEHTESDLPSPDQPRSTDVLVAVGVCDDRPAACEVGEGEEDEEDSGLCENPTPGRWKLPTQVRVWQGEREMFVPMSDVRDTDLIQVEAGEMILVKGIVTEGSAWVLIGQNPLDFHFPSSYIPPNVHQLTTGDCVNPEEIVLVGSIQIVPEISG